MLKNKKECSIQRKVSVWNIPIIGNKTLRAATIEHGPRIINPNCEGCSAPCCKGYAVVLNSREFLFRKFKFNFRIAPDYITKFAPLGKSGHQMVTIPIIDGCCHYLDPETNRCRAWPDIPQACLAYDCRQDDRPEISAFVRQQKQQEKWK